MMDPGKLTSAAWADIDNHLEENSAVARGVSADERIRQLTLAEALDAYLAENGIIGYTRDILSIVAAAATPLGDLTDSFSVDWTESGGTGYEADISREELLEKLTLILTSGEVTNLAVDREETDEEAEDD